MEELDLKELLTLFWEKKLLIIIIMLVFILVGIVYSYFFVTPQYESYTTLLLVSNNNSQSTTNPGITQSDITLNQQLVATYTELAKSKTVLREVISNLGLDRTYEGLVNKISVSFAKNTELIKITARDTVPEVAKDIANETANVFTKKVKEYLKMDNVNLIDEAETDYTPANVNHVKDVALFAFIGLVLAVMLILLLNMLNTTIRSASDIENVAKVMVLAEIPRYTFEEKGGRN